MAKRVGRAGWEVWGGLAGQKCWKQEESGRTTGVAKIRGELGDPENIRARGTGIEVR